MKKFHVDYAETWKNSPLAYWVHRETDRKPFWEAEAFDPPAPRKDLNGKYKIYHVEFDGVDLEFSSREQYQHFIEVMSCRLLPRSLDLSRERCSSCGPNSHWLSRLPADLKKWKTRQTLVKYLLEIRGKLFGIVRGLNA